MATIDNALLQCGNCDLIRLLNAMFANYHEYSNNILNQPSARTTYRGLLCEQTVFVGGVISLCS